MTKLIQVVLSSIFLLAAFLTVTMTWDACTSKKAEKTLEEKADEAFEKYDSDDGFFEDDLEDSESTYDVTTQDDGSSTDESVTEPSVDYSDYEDKGSEAPEPREQVVERPTIIDVKYLVVAGNFLVKENAASMVSKLKQMGFGNAEWAVFDYSQYYTVIANRTNDYRVAQSSATELKGRGIDCYVHTKK